MLEALIKSGSFDFIGTTRRVRLATSDDVDVVVVSVAGVIVTIGGIVSQIKKSKIKKGRNEGQMMAKFFLDDQAGSVEVVVFSDLYAKYMRWLENGVAVLVTANVKDTGGQQAGRSRDGTVR